MTEYLQALALQLGVSVSTLTLTGVAIGAFIILVSVVGGQRKPDPVIGRLRAGARVKTRTAAATGLLRNVERAPKGIMKSFVPEEADERSRVRQQLNQAGFTGENAVRNFYLLRLVFGIIVPLAVLGVIVFGQRLDLPPALDERLASLSNFQTLQIVGVLIAVGFYGPSWWLGNRMRARKLILQQEFPKALDLLQVSVEAGLGLDAAMKRVAEEMAEISPEISQEFLLVQSELLAGRDRAGAMMSMARRMDIDEAMSFCNVVLQSMQYGSSISEALQVYATEMRVEREMRAQEMANKLPVKMSGVMAMLLLPALLMITLGPVVIRYVRFFGEG